MRRILTNNKNKGKERKRVLTPANSDYLTVSGGSTWVNASDIDFEIEGVCTFGSGNQCIFCRGTNNVGSTGLIYITRTTATTSTLAMWDINSTNQQNVFTIPILDGAFSLKVKNLEVIVNGGLFATMTEQAVNISQDNATFGRLSYANLWHLNASINTVKYDNETFSLNEGNGVNFKGSLGTIGSCNTSASNPENYINQVMIKRI